ncbi:Indole-3-pyruvate decarboxylase [Candidatus Terasakiella magnetica]|uniref:Indole-3-pyruvate decarboxylase n=1 Tax=Candidatus Terasakiella magnetica TaxID=1867952 RepID=A0A1C3RIL6_9PROT|nr:indolepyruvate/phenylpyruvate decarboxylase [Candidatus Terasakiella magnetica]SCA57106.1 Indole-3-pyruvate decarboxylase [Candidatus Terasakiella magnetica]
MLLAEALFHALKDRGAREVFGIPGDFALPYFKILEDSQILPLHTLSHEPGVGFAADAAGRFNSRLGIAAVTYGAGALNMVNPVAQAYVEKSPLVVISGAPGKLESMRGLGLHHQVKRIDSQYKIFEEITCAQIILDDAKTAPKLIADALDRCIEQSRPIYIEFPRDMVAVEVDPVPAFHPSCEDMEAARACAKEVLAHLNCAEKPCIMAGVEVRRFGLEEKLAELTHTLGIPVVTSFMARGILVDTEAPLIGTYLGLAGTEEVRKTVERSDGLLMLGVILSDTNFGVSKREIDMRSVVHAFDRDVHFAHHSYPNVPLEFLIEAMIEIASPLGDAKKLPAPTYPYGLKSDDSAIAPTDVACAVNDMFVKHGRMPIASDMGDCLFTAMDIENTALIAPGYYASMGPGVPAGLAIQATSGQRPLIMVGDGAFQMTGWELGNCRKYGWNPIVLLFNNKSWEMLRTFQPGPNYHDLDDWGFAAIAGPLGGKGVRVKTHAELIDALEAAQQDSSCFHLIEIMLERGEISQTLNRFVNAVKRLSVAK